MKHLIRNTVVSLGLALAALNPAQADSVYFDMTSPSVTVGSPFTLTLLGDFTELAGGTINLGYNGNLLQINSVVVNTSIWDFVTPNPVPCGTGTGGAQTATGINSKWCFGFDQFSAPQSGSGITIATLNLTTLMAGTSSLSILGTSEFFSSIDILSPTLGAASITTITPAAVPLPPAVWLFVSGLLGLLGIARRRTCSEK